MTETNPPELNPGTLSPRILIPLPDRDFDPTECAIPWQVCVARGWSVSFSTEHGQVARGDPLKLKGPLPGLLSAGAKARAAYAQMTETSAYQHPVPYAEVDPDQYHALLLPGGDTPNMRQYLESGVLRSKVLQFWQQGKLIGAICHGVLVLARTIDPQTGRSVLYGHRITALPKTIDRAASLLDRWLMRRGYLIYSPCVAEEVRACLKRPDDLLSGSSILVPYAVSDGKLITARTYGDAELFARRFADELQQIVAEGATA